MNPDRKCFFCLALSGSIGLASSSGTPFAIAATAFAPVLWIIQGSRCRAFAVAAIYYGGAVWPVIPAERNFLGPSAGFVEGIGLWVVAILLLASPWPWLWTADSRHLLWRTPVGILLTVVPPPGIDWLGLSSDRRRVFISGNAMAGSSLDSRAASAARLLSSRGHRPYRSRFDADPCNLSWRSSSAEGLGSYKHEFRRRGPWRDEFLARLSDCGGDPGTCSIFASPRNRFS